MQIDKPRFGPEQYPAGSVIIHQGDLPEKFYIITTGYADVEHDGPQGKHIIDRLRPGDFFGEIGLLKQRRRNATVRARSDMTVMAMDRQTFANWLNTSGLVQEEIKELMDIRQKRVEQWGGSDDEPLVAEMFHQPPAESSEETAVSRQTSSPGQGALQFLADDVIVRQGTPANRFYIIIEGEVEVVQQDDKGREIVVGRLNDGQYFGEIGLLEGSERTATIRAISDVKLFPFTREQFRSWLDKSPDSKGDIEETAHSRLLRDTGPLRPPK
jgi:CRP-like cAMP-binding protein